MSFPPNRNNLIHLKKEVKRFSNSLVGSKIWKSTEISFYLY
ncbi:hypothetical protein ES332_D02G190400v1 [Gossypium tomentosum]|uniref:Uncharacterized protein n=1 Tax=Gossypium tomentosum TaxID=34277 RepID=A0A5D2LZ55_GOSTO|nr:hypothetical protein ES332_D02G190400v1 [Gossypium tomentosum]